MGDNYRSPAAEMANELRERRKRAEKERGNLTFEEWLEKTKEEHKNSTIAEFRKYVTDNVLDKDELIEFMKEKKPLTEDEFKAMAELSGSETDAEYNALNYTYISEYIEFYDTAEKMAEKYGGKAEGMLLRFLGNFYELYFKPHKPYDAKTVCEQCKTCKHRCGYGRAQNGYSTFRNTLIDDYLMWGCLKYDAGEKPDSVYRGNECPNYEKD